MITNQIQIGYYIQFHYFSPTKEGEKADRTFTTTNGEQNVTRRQGIFKIVEILEAGKEYTEEIIFKWYEPQTEKQKASLRKFVVGKQMKIPRAVIDKGTSFEVIPLSYKGNPYCSITAIYESQTLAKSVADRLKIKFVP